MSGKWRYLLVILLIISCVSSGYSQIPSPLAVPGGLKLEVTNTTDPKQVSVTIQVLILLTILSVAPSILVLLTCFTRITIVLSFTRRALATQQTPSNQVLIGLALFLTFFVMAPVFSKIKTEAFDPYMAGQIGLEEAYNKAIQPLKKYMLKNTMKHDIALFLKISREKKPKNAGELPIYVLIPAYVVSEMKVAFKMGFLIFIPFLIVDMVVASVLMSMGMIMLPPVMVSLPFKVLLFLMVDGWGLIVEALIRSYK